MGKGSLNNEMAKALVQDVKQKLIQLDQHMERHAKADDISYPTVGESLSQLEKAQTQDKKARK